MSAIVRDGEQTRADSARLALLCLVRYEYLSEEKTIFLGCRQGRFHFVIGDYADKSKESSTYISAAMLKILGQVVKQMHVRRAPFGLPAGILGLVSPPRVRRSQSHGCFPPHGPRSCRPQPKNSWQRFSGTSQMARWGPSRQPVGRKRTRRRTYRKLVAPELRPLEIFFVALLMRSKSMHPTDEHMFVKRPVANVLRKEQSNAADGGQSVAAELPGFSATSGVGGMGLVPGMAWR